MIERPDGSVTTLKATERIYIDKPGQPGAKELLYVPGDPIRQEDAVALGLLNEDGSAPTVRRRDMKKQEPAEEKAASGGKRKVPRDKAMRGPREPAKEE